MRISVAHPKKTAALLALLTLAALGEARAATSTCITLSGFGGSSPLNPLGAPFEPRDCFQSSTSGTSALAVAESSGDRGVFRANATASFGSGENPVASGRSIWNEQFVIIDHPDPSQNGVMTGTFFYEIFLEGFLDVTGDGTAIVQIRNSSSYVSDHAEFSASANATTGPMSIGQVIEGALPFRFGESFQFKIELLTEAKRRPNSSGAGFAEAVFGGTGYFGGITRVVDGFGVEVQGFSFSGSNSGFSFTQSLVPQPVPLPAPVWLLAAGFAVLGRWARRASPGFVPPQ